MYLQKIDYLFAVIGGVFLGIPVGLVFGLAGAAFLGMNGFIAGYILGNIVCILALIGKFDSSNRKKVAQETIINQN